MYVCICAHTALQHHETLTLIPTSLYLSGSTQIVLLAVLHDVAYWLISRQHVCIEIEYMFVGVCAMSVDTSKPSLIYMCVFCLSWVTLLFLLIYCMQSSKVSYHKPMKIMLTNNISPWTPTLILQSRSWVDGPYKLTRHSRYITDSSSSRRERATNIEVMDKEYFEKMAVR